VGDGGEWMSLYSPSYPTWPNFHTPFTPAVTASGLYDSDDTARLLWNAFLPSSELVLCALGVATQMPTLARLTSLEIGFPSVFFPQSVLSRTVKYI
jgi:hypothetical protein